MVEFLRHSPTRVAIPSGTPVHSTSFGALGDSSYFGTYHHLSVHQLRLGYTYLVILGLALRQ